jgi:hypothetical protein
LHKVEILVPPEIISLKISIYFNLRTSPELKKNASIGFNLMSTVKKIMTATMGNFL